MWSERQKFWGLSREGLQVSRGQEGIGREADLEFSVYKLPSLLFITPQRLDVTRNRQGQQKDHILHTSEEGMAAPQAGEGA